MWYHYLPSTGTFNCYLLYIFLNLSMTREVGNMEATLTRKTTKGMDTTTPHSTQSTVNSSTMPTFQIGEIQSCSTSIYRKSLRFSWAGMKFKNLNTLFHKYWWPNPVHQDVHGFAWQSFCKKASHIFVIRFFKTTACQRNLVSYSFQTWILNSECNSVTRATVTEEASIPSRLHRRRRPMRVYHQVWGVRYLGIYIIFL